MDKNIPMKCPENVSTVSQNWDILFPSQSCQAAAFHPRMCESLTINHCNIVVQANSGPQSAITMPYSNYNALTITSIAVSCNSAISHPTVLNASCEALV